jgi:hypothetical protein
LRDTLTIVAAGAATYFAWDYFLYRQKSDVVNSILAPLNPPATAPGGAAVKNAPRGIRYNNPGNIKFVAGQNWVGQVGKNGPFCTFDTPVNGLRAATIIIRKYINSYNLNTLAKIGPRWSPDYIGTSGQYAANASKFGGLGVNTIINPNDGAQLVQVLKGIVGAENGAAWVNHYSGAVYSAAVAAAG